MRDAKECIMCFSEIDLRAKKCPKCQSSQGKYSNLESNPVLIGILGLFFVGLFGYIWFQLFFDRDIKDKAVNQLVITVIEHSTIMEGDSLYIACIGSVNNNTEYTFENVIFEVNFLSDDGHLIDTFPIKDNEIHISSNSVTNFRVRGLAQKSKELYHSCSVKIVDAWAT